MLFIIAVDIFNGSSSWPSGGHVWETFCKVLEKEKTSVSYRKLCHRKECLSIEGGPPPNRMHRHASLIPSLGPRHSRSVPRSAIVYPPLQVRHSRPATLDPPSYVRPLIRHSGSATLDPLPYRSTPRCATLDLSQGPPPQVTTPGPPF